MILENAMDKHAIMEMRRTCQELSVLYVEDLEDLRERMHAAFSKIFFSVDTASNGQEGLEKYKKAVDRDKTYDLVISDIQMPVMDGLDMLYEIQKIKSEQRFIITTVSTDTNHFVHSIELGVDGFLLKPIDATQMKTVLIKISKSINAERSLQKHIDSIEELNASLIKHDNIAHFHKMKDDLLRNLSHEIKTPLNTIQSTVQVIMKKSADDPKFSKLSESVLQSIQKITRMTDRMIQLSNLQTHKYQLLHKAIMLPQHTNQIISSLEKEAAANDLSITLHIDRILQQAVMYDSTAYRTILYELLENAIKFTPSGGKIELGLYYNEQLEKLSIFIKDNGIGMNAEQKELCYELFYQADASLTREAEGCGIGLSLVKHIVELLDGKIKINTSPDSGTVIKVDTILKVHS